MIIALLSVIKSRFWYENGCMFPDMGTVWMAVDRATRENGCVQVRLLMAPAKLSKFPLTISTFNENDKHLCIHR